MTSRVRLLALLAPAFAALATLPASASVAAPEVAAQVNVYFLQGEQMLAVKRPGSTAEDAITALLAGPTRAEVRRGIRTYVPAGTPLGSVRVENGVATVDLGVRFVRGTDAASLLARLSQVVYTLTGPEGATKVRVLVKGGTPLGLFPGADTAGAITVKYLQAPKTTTPKPPPPSPTPVSEGVRGAQERLVQLGYLLPGDADGRLGPGTQAAIIAFQKWEGLQRDGQLGPQTLGRLRTASRPRPITRGGSGKRAEVLLDRQVALAIDDNEVVRAIHVSTGAPATPTPPGDFRVYAKIPRWWSTPFQEWLLWASPFNGGIAFHELAEVPVYPASHGCVRITHAQARWMYDFNVAGMPVKVLTSSR